MSKITFQPIGVIHSEHIAAEKTPIQPVYAKGCKGRAEIFPKFAAGLRDLEGFSHIYLLYHLHQAGPPSLIVKPFLQDAERGVFATRSPSRPNPIGLSIVELVRREDNVLYLDGVDMLDGTPLLDIKPYTAKFDCIETARNGWQDEVDEETAQRRGQRGYESARQEELGALEAPLDSEVLENHKRYEERKALYKRYGYDVEAERAFIIEKARPISGKILEAGTGKGYFALALAQEGLEFTSFDVSASEQKYALLNLLYYGWEKQAHLDIADAESLPYDEGAYDFIFTINMIHHLSNARKVCDEFIRVLSPSGILIISDLNSHGLAVMDQIHALEGRRHDVGPDTLAHVKKILMGYGFEVEQHSWANQDTLIACRRHS